VPLLQTSKKSWALICMHTCYRPCADVSWILISGSVFAMFFLAIAGNNEKVLDIKHFIVAHDLDLFGGCKANLNWHALPDPIQIREWFQMADGCCTFHAHNLHKNFGPFQYGGTFWITPDIPQLILLWQTGTLVPSGTGSLVPWLAIQANVLSLFLHTVLVVT